MKIPNDRRVATRIQEPLLNLRHRRRSLRHIHCPAHNLRSRLRQLHRLLKRRRYIGRIGVRHRLHDNRRASAHQHVSHEHAVSLPPRPTCRRRIRTFNLCKHRALSKPRLVRRSLVRRGCCRGRACLPWKGPVLFILSRLPFEYESHTVPRFMTDQVPRPPHSRPPIITNRQVPRKATGVSFFCCYESVVDTLRRFGVHHASSLVTGGPASGQQPSFHLRRQSIFLSSYKCVRLCPGWGARLPLTGTAARRCRKMFRE